MQALNLKGISVRSIELIPKSSINTDKKRRAIYDEDSTTTACNSSDGSNLVLNVNYPSACAPFAACRKKYNETVHRTIAILKPKFAVKIPTANDSLDVQFTFCSFHPLTLGKYT